MMQTLASERKLGITSQTWLGQFSMTFGRLISLGAPTRSETPDQTPFLGHLIGTWVPVP
jgi:hypothetical protein